MSQFPSHNQNTHTMLPCNKYLSRSPLESVLIKILVKQKHFTCGLDEWMRGRKRERGEKL